MKFKIIWLLSFFCFQILNAQEGFQFQTKKNKITIPFELLNNLIIMPVEVNGVKLNFLLDTGVEESVLFSLDETNEIRFDEIEKIKIKGFGINEAFYGYKSLKNTLKIKEFLDSNHTLYLVLDQDINISSQIGIPVNGILGYHFFKNHKIKINYQTKKITIFNNIKNVTNNNKNFTKIPLIFHEGKPHLIALSNFDNSSQPLKTKLLIDSGNSDAIWLFKNKNDTIKIANSNFDDFLGRGFSGDVFGKRARILSIEIASIKLNNPLISYPDSTAIHSIDYDTKRLGSLGSEVLRRFIVIFDYKSNALFLKRNSHYNEPFNFNMSGIDIQHQGLQWIKETYQDMPIANSTMLDSNGDRFPNTLKYKFSLKPIYIISNIRKNSPADLVGLQKEDVIIKINKRKGYSFKLQEINELLKSEEGKTIEFQVERNGKPLKFKFQLKSLL